MDKINHSDKTAIQLQTKFIVSIFLILVLGLLFLLVDNFWHIRKKYVNAEFDRFKRQATLLDNTLGQVVNHATMMRSVAKTHLSASYTQPLNNEDIKQMQLISKRNIYRGYHYYKCGSYINNHKITSTIIAKDTNDAITETYIKQLLMSLDLQVLQQSYQEGNPNIVLGFYVSKKHLFSQTYPPLSISEMIRRFDDPSKLLSKAFDNINQYIPIKSRSINKVFWTEPYLDLLGNGMMVTCATAVYTNKMLSGIVGADVILCYLDKYTEVDADIYGKSIIATDNGFVISAKEHEKFNKNQILTLSDMLSSDEINVLNANSKESIIEHDGKIIFTINLSNANWKFLHFMQSRAIAFFVINELKALIVAIFLIIIILPIIYIFLLQKSIKPGIKASEDLYALNNELDLKVIERTKELQASESYNKALFENTWIPLVIMDIHTRKITSCNKAAVIIYGCKTKNDVVGRSPLELSADIQYDGSNAKLLGEKYLNDALTTGSLLFEWKHRRPSGEFWDAEIQLTHIAHENKIFLQFSLLDITKRKKSEARRLEVEQQLNHSRKMDAIGQLAGGVAHDFNNVISGIMGAAELLKRSNTDAISQKFIDLILKASHRASGLTSKLLAFGRKGSFELTGVSVHEIINDSIALLEKIVDKKISITASNIAQNCMVLGGTSELQNIFINIGINAAHAMPEGGNISFETSNIFLNQKYCDSCKFSIKPGDYIKITIHDTGCGIKKESLNLIFDPFFTTKTLGKGTGLGLAAVYGDMIKHNGSIEVKSEVEIGTLFSLYLPVTMAENKILQNLNGQKVVKGSGKILLIDDEEIIRLTAKGLIENMGYEVITANNGLDAVNLYKKEQDSIDLVLTDMLMPKMNGRETFYKLREINDKCKVITFSGFVKDENILVLIKDGLAGFISKPFREVELSKLIQKVLNS